MAKHPHEYALRLIGTSIKKHRELLRAKKGDLKYALKNGYAHPNHEHLIPEQIEFHNKQIATLKASAAALNL